MRDVTLVIFNSLRIKCHIRRPLTTNYRCDDAGRPHFVQNLAIKSRCIDDKTVVLSLHVQK